jgi:transketolase
MQHRMETSGASAPLKAQQQKFGFTVDHVVAEGKKQQENTND